VPRICLISPGHLATNPRLVKEANALVEAGYSVVVISARYLPWADQQDKTQLDPRCRWLTPLPFGPHAPPAKRLHQVLIQKLSRALCRLGARQKGVVETAWHPLVADLKTAARKIQADLYIAHYPAALPAAALAAHTHGGRYAFDAEDFHLGDFPEEPAYEFQRQLLCIIEGSYLSGCVYTTAASPGIAKAYADAYGIPQPLVVRNVFPLSQAPEGASPRGTALPGPSLYWFSQTIGPYRGLECAVQALALSQSRPHLVLRGVPSAGYRTALESLAAEHSVAGRLHWQGPAPPEAMVSLAAEHDLGLAAETGSTANRRIALTNKLFTYALAGIPMLLSDIPAHRQILQEAGVAAQLFAVDDPLSLAKAIDHWLAAPASVLAGARAAAFRLGQESWNWEQEQQILINEVAMAISRKPISAQMSDL
jgi:hypothetical protein